MKFQNNISSKDLEIISTDILQYNTTRKKRYETKRYKISTKLADYKRSFQSVSKPFRVMPIKIQLYKAKRCIIPTDQPTDYIKKIY